MLIDRFSAEAQADVFVGGWNGILAMLNVGYAGMQVHEPAAARPHSPSLHRFGSH
jgi:hypothetical protein